ncbi:MAG: helix-turn-helix transcriptional regulator, partial [Dysgonamonadaceae bacterium]|nr:helix-turn-helix transcriptional regulator [Dysgonamonadaceae bacterium]
LKIAIARIKITTGLKQAEIADKLDIKSTYLSDMINGRVPLTENVCQKIYELFHIDVLEDESISIESPKLKQQTYYGGDEMITMPRAVFDQIAQLTETISSQQKTIETLAETNKKMAVRRGDNATCADASGSGIQK